MQSIVVSSYIMLKWRDVDNRDSYSLFILILNEVAALCMFSRMYVTDDQRFTFFSPLFKTR